MPQNSNFSSTRRSSISAQIRLYGYGAKSQWRPPRVHLGANGSKKWIKTVKNDHAPKFEFSTTPRSLILAKIRLYGYGAKSRWGPSWVHLEANGVPLVKKMGQNRKKLSCPKIRLFDCPAVIDFDQNWTLWLWQQITVGTL